jgi:hypothetical protein
MESIAVCSLVNIRGLYVTHAEVRRVVRTWKLLQELGLSHDDPLSGAIVAKKMCNGGMEFLRVEGCEVKLFGTSGHPYSSRDRTEKKKRSHTA